MTNERLDDMFDKVARLFNSNRKTLDEDVVRLEEWLDTQPHLPKLLDKNALRNFLLINKCSIEVTKQKIDNYYTVRPKVPEVTYEMNPKRPYHKELNDMLYIVEHVKVTEEMYKLYFIKVKGETLSNTYNALDLVRRFTILQELRLRQEVMCGDIIVLDLKNYPFSAGLQFTPMLLYKAVILLYEKVLSSRLKAAHTINMAPPLITVINTLKSILKPKLAERIHIYENADDFKKVIPLSLLPVDFGGIGLSLQELEDAQEAKLAKNQELFDCLDDIKVDENLRPGKLEDDDVLGFYGNFKKLEVD